MTHLKLITLSLTAFLLSHQAFSNDVTFIGTKKHTITPTHHNTALQKQPYATPVITLPEYQLSEARQRLLYQQAQETLQPQTSSLLFANHPKQKQLGMGNVPVLDQGQHGTCATFAVTAAADVLINKGARISPLCLLQLGNYLETQGLGNSGWDGINIYDTLDRLTHYGFLTSRNQKKYGCGDVNYYPYDEVDKPYSFIDLQEYTKRRDPLSEQRFTWTKVFAHFYGSPTYRINEIKASLDAGHRVITSTLLPATHLGNAGATARHHYTNDTWVLSKEIIQTLQHQTNLSGHAMIITGYDDHAFATDSHGHRHYGLFTLRNSWGRWVADWGDFYMSYDYAGILTHRGEQLLDNANKT